MTPQRLKATSDQLFEYGVTDVSDILETLDDAWCLSDKGKELYVYHHSNYYQTKSKPWDWIMDRVSKHRETLSEKRKKECIENRKDVANVNVRKFLETKYQQWHQPN